MTDYVLHLGFDGPGFVAVPNHVVDIPDLSADALGVLVYLARLKGAQSAAYARVSGIRNRFGFGKDKWQRIARELRDVGAIDDTYVTEPTGNLVRRSLVVQWPSPGGPENPAP